MSKENEMSDDGILELDGAINEAADEIEMWVKGINEELAATPDAAFQPTCLNAIKATTDRMMMLAGKLSNLCEFANCLYTKNEVDVALADADEQPDRQDQPEQTGKDD
jgi:hypothetical protein